MRTGTVGNISKVHRYLRKRGWQGLIWGSAATDSKNSSKKRLSVILLRGSPTREHQFGIDWYTKVPRGYSNASGKFLPFKFIRLSSDSGLFFFSELLERYYGFYRRTLDNYLTKFDSFLSRVKIFPDRIIDEFELTPVRPGDLVSAGKLPFAHDVSGLSFEAKADLMIYLRDHIRWLTRVRGMIRVNDVKRPVIFNHWKIGPIQP